MQRFVREVECALQKSLSIISVYARNCSVLNRSFPRCSILNDAQRTAIYDFLLLEQKCAIVIDLTPEQLFKKFRTNFKFIKFILNLNSLPYMMLRPRMVRRKWMNGFLPNKALLKNILSLETAVVYCPGKPILPSFPGQ